MMLCGVAYAQMPAAGYQIKNEAFGQFVNESGETYNIKSQPVIVEILPVLAATLTPANDLVASAGQTIYWPHTLTNTGNADDQYRFNIKDESNDSGILTRIQLIHDVNKNGIYDVNDVIINTASHVESLAVGQSMPLLILAQLPATLAVNSQFHVSLKVTASQGVPVLERLDKVYTNAPQLVLNKNVDKTSINVTNANKTLMYSLSFSNTGNSLASGTTISIDGVNQKKVVFDDPLPVGVTFKDVYPRKGGGELLYHLKGEAQQVYHRYNTATLPVLSQIDRVAVAYSSFDVQQEGQIDIEVDAATQQLTQLNNQFLSYYTFGNEEKQAFSNIVTTKLENALFDLLINNILTTKPNDIVVLPHTLQNNGSFLDSYTLTVAQLLDDKGDLLNVIIAKDSNNNGRYDAGVDQETTEVSLNPNTSIQLFVVGTVPTNLVNLDVLKTTLTAQSKSSQQHRSVVDEVIVSSSLGLSFDLSIATDIVVLPSQPFVFKHILKNTGSLQDSYDLSVINLTNDNKDIDNLQLFKDSNNNGIYDVGVDQQVNKVDLNSQQQITLFVVGTTPADAKLNDKINVDLQAKSIRTGSLKNLTDKITVVAATLGSKNDGYTVDKQKVLVTVTNPEDIYLEAGVQQCNTRSDVADKLLLRVRSFALEDATTILDEEFVIAEEAADKTNSGIFRLSNPLKTKSRRDPQTRQLINVTKKNQILEVLTTDKVEVVIVHCLEDDGKTIKKDAQNQDMVVYKDFVTKEEVKTNVLIFELADLKSKNANYSTLKSKILADQKIFLETETEQCNTHINVAEQLLLRVRSFGRDSQGNYSSSYLDEEFVVAIETGKDTGQFRLKAPLPTRSRLEYTPLTKNQILETIAHDKVTATIMHCLDDDGKTIKKDDQGQAMYVYQDPINQVGEVSTDLLVDPFGVVFDSKTGKLLNGAIVKLIRLENGVEVPFKLFDDNLKECEVDANASPACKKTIVTGSLDINGDGVVDSGDDGMFRFPFVPATNGITSFYRLMITTPTGYTFKSLISPTELAANPLTKNRVLHVTGSFNFGDDDGSYGGRFNVLPTDGPVELDIPMDPPAIEQSKVFIEKTSSRKNAELGEFVDYTITINNVSDNKMIATQVIAKDTLPKGFSYVLGSARINKIAIDPQGGTGPILSFSVGDIAADSKAVITYRAHIGSGALHGDGVNRVVATPSNGITSPVAAAAIKVTAGVFAQEAFVIGKVYTDCNRDGVQGLEEIGVPNVRLILEDGTYVVTDVEGKFNFYGLRPITHVLKLDRTSLPEDVELIEQNVRNAGDPASRFVDLKAGEIHRADFAITTDNATCSGPAMAEIYARRNQGDKAIGELERELKTDLTFERNNPSDVRSLPANGCVNYTGNECGLHGKAKMPSLTAAANTNKDKQEDDINRVDTTKDNRSLESYLDNTSSNQLDILNLVEGQVLPYSQTRILFKGVLGARFELSVNDKVLDEKSMGIRMAVAEQRLEAREYIGINLQAGENRIILKQFDSLGNVRGIRSIVVMAPANLAKLLVTTDQKVIEANGSNEVLVSVKLQDESGVPISTRTSITLESNAGRFRAKDLDPQTQGIQLFIEGGEFSVKLLAPTQAGDATIRVSSGVLKTEQNIRFVPELRPMVAAGIIEGMVSFKDFDTTKVQPSFANDGFEAELQSLSSSNDGKLNVGGRAAMFLKGKVKGEYLLTLSYDSNKEADQRLFRDIRPDDYYPVYGDSAVRGFDAQSTSKLYVRLDKGRSYVMFGDYTTRIEGTEALSLGQYNRSLTGIRGHYATDTFKATSFVAQTNAKQRVFEMPAQGISGPYTIPDLDGLKVNSEKVEIIKRDRNNIGLIISTEAKTRFTDYDFEELTSSVYFKAPVPSLDANLNPYLVRITVEVEETVGDDYVVGGVQFEQKLGKKLTVGAAAVQEDIPDDNYQLASANLTVQLTEVTKLIAEVAQSDRETTTLGQASRAELLHATSRVNARIYYGESDKAFENPAAPLTSGRAESGVKATINMDSWGNLLTEAIRTENVTTGGVRYGVKVTISRAFAQYFTAELGGRFYDETVAPANTDNSTNLAVTPYEGVTIHTKLNMQIPQFDSASIYAEYEQDVENSDRKIIAVGGDYRINSQSKLYAKHELSSSVNGGFALNDQQQRNSTVFGIESNYMKDGRVFSEYRVRDAANAEDIEAAIGLRNTWYLTEGLRLNTNFEEIRTLEGSDTGDAISTSLGVEYFANPLWKATAKIDLRWADSADSVLNTLGFAYKISRDWTLLTKNMLNYTDNHGANVGDRIQNRFQLGAAYRQVDINRWDMLTKVEYKLDDNKSTLNDYRKTDSYIFSNHINYHPTRRWTFASQLAAKWYADNSNDLDSDSTTYLLGGRIIHDISERWETSVQAGWLSGDLGGQRSVLGAEVGYLVTTNLWVSGGYNWLSYDDADLVGTDFTVDGAYLRLRFKFDEDLFGGKKPSTNKALEPKNDGL